MARKERPPRTSAAEPDPDKAVRSGEDEVRDLGGAAPGLPQIEASGSDTVGAGSRSNAGEIADRALPESEPAPASVGEHPARQDRTELAGPRSESAPEATADRPEAPRPGENDAEPPLGDETVPQATAAPGTGTPADGVTAAPVAPPPRRHGGIAGLLVGGAVAAALGFLAAQYADPKGWPFAEPGAGTLAPEVAAQAQRLAVLETDLAALRSALDDAASTALAEEIETLREAVAGEQAALRQALGDGLAGLTDRADGLDSALTAISGTAAGLEASVARLSGRIETLERAPIDGAETAEAAVESYRRELAELRALIETVIAENETVRAEARAQIEAAETAARAGRARAALIRLEAALDGGGGFDEALHELAEAGFETPPALSDHARAGIPTRAALQAGFAPAARTALAAAQREVEGLGLGERLGAFFRVQFGIRSLTPREGDDADAILSRAEAAVAVDDTGRALDEIAGLPDSARAAMADWVAAASVRHAARTALSTLAAEIDTL